MNLSSSFPAVDILCFQIQRAGSYCVEALVTSVFDISASPSRPDPRLTLPATTCESASRFDGPAKPETTSSDDHSVPDARRDAAGGAVGVVSKSGIPYSKNSTRRPTAGPELMQSLGVDLTVVPFKLIMDTTVTNQHVHENGQMPALYDCIFRSLYKMEYYVHVDIDELMVPMPNFSFHAMIKEAKRISNGSFGSVMVAVRDITHAGFTKYIARSRTVCEAAVHQVYRHCEGKTSAFLDSFKPYIKHYKRCCSGKPSRIANKFGHFWNVTSLQADASYAEFSARIERNEDQSSVLQFNDPLVVSEA
ncbi:hypothetical protein HPB49_026299 [Dermacentor silvarum]|nr:hypothetical protein HPB49_026299 [Dermacentor silvarum]